MKAPPPTRGWTWSVTVPRCWPGGSPAYAGMDRLPDREARFHIGLPRLRGDGPGSTKAPHGPPLAPPPTRGWTLRIPRGTYDSMGSPAYAGMDPTPERLDYLSRRLPRLRGDGPGNHDTNDKLIQAPPPTRGWTLSASPRIGWEWGSPAYAGMDPHARFGRSSLARLPRLRGDGPAGAATKGVQDAAPPPTRGWTRGDVFRRGIGRGSPAYAGMDPAPQWSL